MGLFDKIASLAGGGIDKTAGEWAAKAMACMAFADGKGPGEAELAAMKIQMDTNRVLKDSLGKKAAETIFHQTVEAIRSLPSVMLQTHEAEVGQLAQKITDPTQKNFAFATVVAVAMGDGTITPAEQQMLSRFHQMLGATVKLPQVGQTMHGFEAQAIQSGHASSTQIEDNAAVICPSCNKPTQFYQDHGHWCAGCQQYAPAPHRKETPAMPLPAVKE